VKILVIGGGGASMPCLEAARKPASRKNLCAREMAASRRRHLSAEEAGDVDGLVAIAEKLRPDLTVIGPELPLVNGLSDALRARSTQRD